MDQKVPTYKKIQISFKEYRKQIRHIWEDASFVEFYTGILHEMVRDGEVETLVVSSILSADRFRRKKESTLGVIIRLQKVSNNRRAFLDAFSTFEDFLSHLIAMVYRDYPGKLIGKSGLEASYQDIKLIEVVVKSEDREEILSRIVEERIRGIFYGNPLNFFTKDRAKLELGDYFRSRYALALTELMETFARRNILVHSGGRVDRKYIREVNASEYLIGQKVHVATPYLRKSLALFDGFGAAAAGLVLQNIYKQKARGPLAKSWRAFERGYADR